MRISRNGFHRLVNPDLPARSGDFTSPQPKHFCVALAA
jgi:hypothetical protein